MLKLSEDEIKQEVSSAFERFYLSIPDADETLLKKHEGNYENDFIASLFWTFNKGFRSCLISMIAKAEFKLNINS